MAPLTSPSSCLSCARLAEKIIELEGRISAIYQIQEAEKLLDTIIFGPAQAASTGTRATGATPPCPAAAATSPPEPAVAALGSSADVPPPLASSDDSWTRLGAKPKVPISSTPSHVISESRGECNRRGGRAGHAPSNFSIQLENKFNILDENDFPPLLVKSKSPLLVSLSTPLLHKSQSTVPPYRSTPVLLGLAAPHHWQVGPNQWPNSHTRPWIRKFQQTPQSPLLAPVCVQELQRSVH